MNVTSRVVFLLVASAGLAVSSSAAQTLESVFLVHIPYPNGSADRFRFIAGCAPEHPGVPSFDLALVEFSDNGTPVNPAQLDAAADCIRQASVQSPAGVITVLFVHGWRHGSFWDFQTGERDAHLAEFQQILARLTFREAERAGGAGRRVVGVYVGWPGIKTWRIPVIGREVSGDITTFWDRYDLGQSIARGPDFQRALLSITAAARQSPESIVINIGHSMGGMLLSVAYAALLRSAEARSSFPVTVTRGCSTVTGLPEPDLLPDVVMMLNTAALASMSDSLRSALGGARKQVWCVDPFDAPLFVSVTSDSDRVTSVAFRIGMAGRETEGHADRLNTHVLDLRFDAQRGAGRDCSPAPGPDFGQGWHCLRHPEIRDGQIQEVRVDLPQLAALRDFCHDGYVLRRTAVDPGPLWVIRVPDRVMSGHGDIFNARSGLFAMALGQLSGAVLSLAVDYSQTFEVDRGACQRE